MRFTITAALLLVSTVVLADGIKIEKFRFEWRVAESGEARFSILKTEEGTTPMISSGRESLKVSAQDAEAVGTALKKADAFFGRGPGERNEYVAAGGMRVGFSVSPKTSYVSIQEKDNDLRSPVVLTRKQASDLRVAMTMARKAVDLVDQKVRP